MAEEKGEKKIIKQENRKRAVFMVKLLMLIGLLYINFHYDAWMQSHEVFLSGVVKGLLFYLIANLLVSIVRIMLVHIYIRQKKLESEANNVVLAINRMATLLNVAVLIATAFLLLGLTWATFFTSFSLVAVATVILTKDYISNTVNGLIIMMSDRISLNDYIKVGHHKGKVIDITLSNVHLLDEAERIILIPNNTVFGSDIINYTRNGFRYVEVNFELKPEKLTGLSMLEQQLTEAIYPYAHLVRKDSYELRVIHVLMDKISLQFRFILHKPEIEKERELEYLLLRTIADQVLVS